MINIEVDMRPLVAVMESNAALAKAMGSQKVMDSLNGLAAEAASQSFNELMDAAAPSQEQRLGHMYDWNEVGEESGRLWKMIIVGSAKNKVLTFDYKESRNDVPAGSGETGIAGDTRTGGHVFRWKAPIIENGTRVRVEPVNGQWLAIPTEENGSGSKRKNSTGTMWFSRGPVSPPINRIAQGAFTEMWVQHFGTVAVRIVEEVVAKEVEKFFEYNVPSEVYANIPKPKVNPRPTKSSVKRSNQGRVYYKNALGKFVSKVEAQRLGLQAQRFGDNA